MLSQIRDDIEKALFLQKMSEISEIFEKQSRLPKESRVGKEIIMKLEELYRYLENEITKYDKIEEL
jgi:hypothetical protein